MARKKAHPYFTDEQAASLVRGEEHRLLVRRGKPGLTEEEKAELAKKVAKAASFEAGLEVIADAL